MATRGEMVRQMSWQAPLVKRNKQTILALRPFEYSGVGRAQWKVCEISDANTIDDECTATIILLDWRPKRDQILIQQIFKSHFPKMPLLCAFSPGDALAVSMLDLWLRPLFAVGTLPRGHPRTNPLASGFPDKRRSPCESPPKKALETGM